MPDASALAPSTPPAPAGIGPWGAYRTLLSWQLAQIGGLLPLLVVVQALLAAGIVIGFGLLVPGVDAATAVFLTTGAPTVLLLTIGLAIVPQGVARTRLDGTFTYMRALPVPRPLLFLADLTVWVAICVPSVGVAVLVGWLRYDLRLSFDWPLLVCAALLVAVTATAVGYAIAVLLKPMLAQLVSQVLVFFVLLFSPVTFPADRLPGWYRTLHDVLPVRPGADLLRAGLASDLYEAAARDLLVLLCWCAAGVAISLRALVRRD
ncbi:multidrug ABC transporter permease [Actinomadura sp. CNU-125]|uniref:ABC transporter permease n=1 Tax=Actinomadura sp. CNU-125 TaxID=1904961 RepID=UPI00095B7E18|nr:ABC transporter permease [Actinomadura sp. CNU-125]OLT30832.1 multidrug ABC transporter permease [Actinomadura sp. CNU-125]